MGNNNQSNAAEGWTEYGGVVSTFVRPAALKAGTVIQGTFDRLEDEMGKFKKPAIFLTLTSPLTYGDKDNAERTYEAGEQVCINAAGNLPRLISQSAPSKGAEMRIVYEGMQVIASGEYKGSESHTFKLAVKQSAQLPG